MNTLKHRLPVLLLLAGLGFASAASASLESRPGGMVYDTDRNITWLADANLAASNTFGVGGINADGSMTWGTAQSWVAAMDTANYLGYSDWRLPATLQPDGSCSSQSDVGSYGDNCTGSELGHLFYQELGATAGSSILTGNGTELAKFSNIHSYVYWSGTEFAPDPFLLNAWIFDASSGFQGVISKDSAPCCNGWAVRSGDVAAVPLPAAVWLFGSALTGLTLLGARRRHG